MRKLISLAALLLCLLLPWTSIAEGTITATYYLMETRENAEQAFAYDDALFDAPATTYLHELARCSLGLAVASFRADGAALNERDQNVRDFLTQAGFGDFDSQEFDVEPSIDTIASFIGSKTVGDATVLAVGISGQGYQNEWLSNFSIGDSEFHEGFANASLTVYSRIVEYIQARGLELRSVKVWMSGFSRAAAVSNVTGCLLQEGLGMPAENLYVYTFATPNCAKAAADYDCPSIFNIVGSCDPVPCVPFSQWGYKRFGTTLYLPSQENAGDYALRKAATAVQYKASVGIEYWNNPEVNWFLRKTMQIVNNVTESTDDYTKLLQNTVMDAWRNKGDMMKLLRGLYFGVMSSPELREKMDLESWDASDVYSVFAYDLVMERLGIFDSYWGKETSMAIDLFHEHCPAVYMAWMLSQDDPSELFMTSTAFRYVQFSAKTDCAVTDESGEPREGFASFRLGDETMLCLPSDTAYTLTFTPAEDCTFSMCISEASSETMGERVIAFNEEDYHAGDNVVLRLPKDHKAPDTAYTLTINGSAAPTPFVSDGVIEENRALAVINVLDSGDAATNFVTYALYALAGTVVLVLGGSVLYGVRHRRRRKALMRVLDEEDGTAAKA